MVNQVGGGASRMNRRRAGGGGEGGGQNNNHPSYPCPRCNSSITKFCYYNNYSLSQPRHFCKACRRYWTHGGTLRNVPVGGGCRKNRRPKQLDAASASALASSVLQQPVAVAAATGAAATAVGNTNTYTDNILFGHGSTSAGMFMSSLAEMHQQGVSQPLTFGMTNLGLLHEFTIPALQAQRQREQQQADYQDYQFFHNMFPMREIGESSSVAAGDWNLGGIPPPAPPVSETSVNNNNNNTNTNNMDDQTTQWSDYMGNSGA